jgi:hypothetical protein
MYGISNLVDKDAPIGKEKDFKVVETIGRPRDFNAEGIKIKDHVELGEELKLIDLERGAKVSGSRFYYLVGDGALLELALVNFAIDIAQSHGFTPVIPPALVKPAAMEGTGFLGQAAENVYRIEQDDMYLVGSNFTRFPEDSTPYYTNWLNNMSETDIYNQRFREWGLKSTAIHQNLPDLEGTNTTSAEDLVFLLSQIDQGKLVSLRSRDRLLNIMTATKNNSLIPQGVESKAIVAHKTGDIGSVLADAGIVDIPNGKRYLVAIIVKRPHNDLLARSIIQEISRTAYQHFKWYEPRRVNNP